MGSLAIEFCALGFFAGILATVGSEITVFMLETEIFELDYEMNPELWILGPVVGIVLIGAVGTFAYPKSCGYTTSQCFARARLAAGVYFT